MTYTNMYAPGKGPGDYEEPECIEGYRYNYIQGNRARLIPWAEYALPEIGTGRVLIQSMPTKLLWALQSRWFMDREVGWKAKDVHWNKLIKFWVAGIPEKVVAEHIKLVLPDAEVEIEEKDFAPFPGVHRKFVDGYDLKVTRNGKTKFFEVKKTRKEFSMFNPGIHGPEPNLYWVAKREQVQDKLANTEAWIWLNNNMTCMRIIKASTFSAWKLETYLSQPQELWYAAPLELWQFKTVRKKHVEILSGNSD